MEAIFNLENPLFIITLVTLILQILFWGLLSAWGSRPQDLVLTYSGLLLGLGLSAHLLHNRITTVLLIAFLAVSLGKILRSRKSFHLELFAWPTPPVPYEKRLGAIVLFMLFLFYWRSWIPGGHSDVVTYHLLASKEWAVFQEAPYFRPDFPHLFMASLVDYGAYGFFLLLKPLLLATRVLPQVTTYESLLVMGHLWGQMTMAVCAFILTPLMIFLFLQKYPYWRVMGPLLVVGFKMTSWTWFMAKNDIYPLCALMAAWIFLEEIGQESRDKTTQSLFLRTFFLLGMIVSSKFTNLFFFCFLPFLIPWDTYKIFFKIPRTQQFLAIVIFLITASFTFTRNTLLTQNPFFPIEKLGFQNIYFGQPHLDYVMQFAAPSTLSEAWVKFQFFMTKGWILVILVLYAFYHRIFVYPLCLVASIFILCKMTGPPIEWRLFSVLLFFILYLMRLVVAKISVPPLRPFPSMNFIALVTAIFIHSHTPWGSLLEVPQGLNKSAHQVLHDYLDFQMVLDHNQQMSAQSEQNYLPLTKTTSLYYSRFPGFNLDMAQAKWHRLPARDRYTP